VSERLRLFVALDLPDAVRSALAEWCAAAAPEGVRRVPVDNLHLTLAFLGQRSTAEALAVGERLVGLARPLEALRTAGTLWLPPRRPGVLAVAIAECGGLSALHADLVQSLVETVGFEPERRPFRPHVTLARVRRPGSVRATALAPAPPALAVEPVSLTLYRSFTAAGGARYEALARVALAE
jgi:2'-5' RNA ligase